VERAEVCFVPTAVGHSKKGLEYRYLATREAMRDTELPGLESLRELPFPTMHMNQTGYKVFGVVTNMDWEGEKLIHMAARTM